MSPARAMTLEDYWAMPWSPIYEQLEDGSWRCIVKPLADFEMFAPTWEELWREWRVALRGHLRAYWAVGKPIPTPRPRITQLADNEWLLSWAGNSLWGPL